jgi:NarL family two-component system sensor histidine kinase LiaS
MRLFDPLFRRLNLGTKLTLSYTVITVAPLLVIEIASFFALWLLVLVINITATATSVSVSAVINSIAPQLQPYFESEPPDGAGAAQWLIDNTTLDSQLGMPVWIVDAELRGLARLPETGGQFDAASVPGLDRLVRAARGGETDPGSLYTFSPDGTYTAIAPIHNRRDEVAGFLIVTASLPRAEDLYQQLIANLGLYFIGFTVIAGLAGTFFGYLTVRGLTQRLKAATQMTEAWGKGDFSQQIHDTSGDEIGQLSRRLNQMAEQLDTLMQTRQALSVMDERNRLARDLHDSVKQQVFSIAMQLGAIRSLIEREPGAALEPLAEAERLAKQAQQELSVLINELRPAALAGKGLAEALREHVAHWSRQNHIAADMRVQGERTLPLLHEQTLFRVAQEALANVTRHSRATKVTVQLVYEKDAIMLTIVDNGQGFDPDKLKKKGLGLSSMQERMAVIGGSLQLFSQPGAGTRIVAYCVKGQDV